MRNITIVAFIAIATIGAAFATPAGAREPNPVIAACKANPEHPICMARAERAEAARVKRAEKAAAQAAEILGAKPADKAADKVATH